MCWLWRDWIRSRRRGCLGLQWVCSTRAEVERLGQVVRCDGRFFHDPVPHFRSRSFHRALAGRRAGAGGARRGGAAKFKS